MPVRTTSPRFGNLRGGARAKEPIVSTSLAIGGQCLEIGPNDRGDRSSLSPAGNLAWRRLALTQRFLQAFDRHRQANLIPISEAIGDGLGNAEDLYVHPLDSVGFNTLRQETRRMSRPSRPRG